MSERSFLQDIEAGSLVKIAGSHQRNGAFQSIRRVSRVTGTQIIFDDNNRYKILNGWPVGGGNYDHIIGTATEKEFKEYTAKVSAENKKRGEETARRKEHEAFLLTLSELFENGYVRDANFGKDGLFEITLYGLTEKQVRDIAKKIKA